MNRTLFLIKPGFINLGPEVMGMLIGKGISIEKCITVSPGVSLWKEHYIEHAGKPFYEELCEDMADKPVIAMLVSTQSSTPCWEICRELLGATDPKKALPNTIRGKYGISIRHNTAHTSDSLESAERELALWGLI